MDTVILRRIGDGIDNLILHFKGFEIFNNVVRPAPGITAMLKPIDSNEIHRMSFIDLNQSKDIHQLEIGGKQYWFETTTANIVVNVSFDFTSDIIEHYHQHLTELGLI